MEMETSRPLYTINFIPFVCSTTQTEYCVVGDSAGYISLYSVPQGSLIANFKVSITVLTVFKVCAIFFVCTLGPKFCFLFPRPLLTGTKIFLKKQKIALRN